MAKTANLNTRIEPEVKEEAEEILSQLGLSASTAVNLFYKQIIIQRGLPFEVKFPTTKILDVSTISEAEIDAELEKAYQDALEENTQTAKDTFASIRKDYDL